MPTATKLSSYIGPRGAFFKRVCLVFEGLGYLPPTPDTTTNGPTTGAYAANIADQYRANFTQNEILKIIQFAKDNSVHMLEHMKKQGWIDRESVFDERS